MYRFLSLGLALSLFIPGASGKKNFTDNIGDANNRYEVPASEPDGGKTSGYNGNEPGNNIVSLSPLLLNNLGFGFGISYERILTTNGKWSLFVPILYNSVSKEAYGESYRDRSIGMFAGFRFYPASSKGPIKYAIGLLAGDYVIQRKYSHIDRLGGSYDTDKSVSFHKTGMLIDNAVLCTISRKVTIGLDLGLGVAGSTEEHYDASVPFILMMFQLGYRF